MYPQLSMFTRWRQTEAHLTSTSDSRLGWRHAAGRDADDAERPGEVWQGALPGSKQRHGVADAENRRPQQADGIQPFRFTAGNDQPIYFNAGKEQPWHFTANNEQPLVRALRM